MKPAPRLIVCAALLGVVKLSAQTANTAVAATVANAASAANVGTSTTIAPVSPSVIPPADPTTRISPTLTPGSPEAARVLNLSTRARLTAESPLISGFAIRGTGTRPVLVRAAGPGLTNFGVSGALANPRLRVHAADGSVLADNRGWANTPAVAAAAAQAGAFPFAPGSADSAVLLTLPAGNYTAQIVDANGGTGVALAEVYDLGGNSGDARLVNVSTRATVAPAGGELISGFVLAGTAPRQFLIRGIGPGLQGMGVPTLLANPVVTLFNASGRNLATNDDWSGQLTSVTVASGTGSTGSSSQTVQLIATNAALAAPLNSAATATGAFPLTLGSNDAALLVTLEPGAYTVQITGAGSFSGTTTSVTGTASGTANAAASTAAAIASVSGNALLELYELP